MKITMNIECENIEECIQLQKALNREKNKPSPPSPLPPNEELPVAPEAPQERFIPLTKWNDYHPWPTTGGLRHLVFFEKTNGFHVCIKRVGHRVIIDEKAFFEWVRQQ